MKLLWESMTKILDTRHYGNFTVRCWREEFGPFDLATQKENKREIMEVLESIERYSSQSEIASILIKMERMNAVEVLDSDGLGPVVYSNWP